MKKKWLIIIPTFNEENRIYDVLKKVKQNIDQKINDILVIDDGSTDDTFANLSRVKGIKTIRHKNNEGYGQSLIDGFRFVIKNNYEFAVTIDCDGQHEPQSIRQFQKEIEKGEFDIVSGSRYMKRNLDLKRVPKDRYRINNKITKIINRKTGLKLTDSFCGFKAYRVSALKRLKLTEKGYGFPIQMWIQAKKNNLKIKELPVELIYLDFSRDFQNRFASPKERYKYYKRIIKNEELFSH